MKLTIIALLFTAFGFSQEAKIMILEKQDTAVLKEAYKQYKEAQAKWEKEKKEIAEKYTKEDGKVIEGWEHVEFSRDFRAVVPSTDSSGYLYLRSGSLSVPAVRNTSAASLTGSAGTLATASDLAVSYDALDGVASGVTTKEK